MKRLMVFLLMVVLAVGLALPSTALAAKAPTIPIKVTMWSGPPLPVYPAVYSDETVLYMSLTNNSLVQVNNVTVELPQLGVTLTQPKRGDLNNNGWLDRAETWLFAQTISPTKSTKYTAKIQVTDPYTKTVYNFTATTNVRVVMTR